MSHDSGGWYQRLWCFIGCHDYEDTGYGLWTRRCRFCGSERQVWL